MIHEGNVEQVMGKDGFLKGIYRTTDDDGKVTEEKEAILKAPSVQYIRFLIKTKATHLVDILQQFMGPVSYTHLDVYKRQIKNRSIPFVCCWKTM